MSMGERAMTNGEKFKEVFGFGVDGSRVIAVNSTWWDCEFQNSKPITNADLIRTMSDEELAEFLLNRDLDVVEKASKSVGFTYKVDRERCLVNVIDWLKQEAEE